jgi:hypothetical protein
MGLTIKPDVSRHDYHWRIQHSLGRGYTILKDSFICFLMAVILAGISISACNKETPEEHQEKVKEKMERRQKNFSYLMHICENNGGVYDFKTNQYDISTVFCVNGLQASIHQ